MQSQNGDPNLQLPRGNHLRPNPHPQKGLHTGRKDPAAHTLAVSPRNSEVLWNNLIREDTSTAAMGERRTETPPQALCLD